MGALLLIILLVGALIGGLAYIIVQQQKKRTAAMQAVAERLGWRFEPKPPFATVPELERFVLFSQGHSRQTRNLMAGEKDGHRVAVFDYTYVIGAGKSQSIYRQTVVHVNAPGLNVPQFVLRPEHVFHKIGELFGYRDIDLDVDPDFSKRYLLRGADEDAVRTTFDSMVREFYDRNPKSSTEAARSDLIFWRTGSMVAPDEVDRQVELALALAGRLRESTAALRPRNSI
jgi:hypothetical protein